MQPLRILYSNFFLFKLLNRAFKSGSLFSFLACSLSTVEYVSKPGPRELITLIVTYSFIVILCSSVSSNTTLILDSKPAMPLDELFLAYSEQMTIPSKCTPLESPSSA